MRITLIALLALVTITCSIAQPLPSHPSPGSSVFFKSLLIPGWGQYTQDRPKAAAMFVASEAALIITSVGLQTYGGWLRSDYRSIAAEYAGIPNGGNRSHNLYVDMGNWMTAEEFNQARARERTFDRQYNDPNDQWRWTNDAQRERFKSIRLRSDQSLDAVKFAIGTVIINHLVSAIEASNYSRKHHSTKVGVSIGGTKQEPTLTLALGW